MKVKYFSEVLNKYYDSEEEVLEAEKEFNERKLKEENKKKELANNKKVMASAIEKAQKELEFAEEELEKANRQAEEIFSKAYEDALALIKPAKDKVEDCQKAKYQAIKEFNKVYGPYSVSYTGEKAYNEWKRSFERLDSIFNRFF